MTTVPAFATPTPEKSAVRLCQYAQYITYDERAFFGLRFDGMQRTACRDVWTKAQRDMVQRYLWEAQFEIEQQLSYPIGDNRWIADEQPYVDDQDLTQHPNVPSYMTRWQYVVTPGIKAVASIDIAITPDYSADPAELVKPVPAGMTGLMASEVAVFLPGTDVEVVPSYVNIAGGSILIQIPWARLVDEAHANNPDTGWDYNDTTVTGPYAQSVDIKRVYNDPTTQAVLTRKQKCRTCNTVSGTACIRVYNPGLGILRLFPDVGSCSCLPWETARLYYKAGLNPVTAQAQEAIIRLAHAKMHTSPCGCDPTQVMWNGDREIVQEIEERQQCPFGQRYGALQAWKWVVSMMIPRISVM